MTRAFQYWSVMLLGICACLTATASAAGLRVVLELPTLTVHPGDEFYIRAYLDNPDGPDLEQVPTFFVLEAPGAYYFWPSWSSSQRSSPDFLRVDIPQGTTRVDVLPAMTWPETGESSLDGLRVYGVLLDDDMETVLGEMGVVAWGYAPKFDLIVSPPEIVLNRGDTQTFTAFRGIGEYFWSLSDQRVGRIDAETGPSVTFTADEFGHSELLVTDSTGQMGLASLDVRSVDLTVVPSSRTLLPGDSGSFEVMGGESPYEWTSSRPAVGELEYLPPGTTCQVTALSEGSSVITVTDALGATATGLLVVECPPITLDPTEAEVPVSKTLQFAVDGGVPPYTWRSGMPFIGTIDSSGLFTGGPWTGLVIITVEDFYGCITAAEVTVID